MNWWHASPSLLNEQLAVSAGTLAEFRARAEGYRRQVELYARAWTRLTGEPVKERVLFYTAQGRTDSW